jgi:hypothetical protein
MDNLDAFEDQFFQRETADEEPAEETAEESDENEDDNPLATDDDKDADEEDTPTEDDADEEDEPDEEPAPQPKPKSKAQQRIEKLLERERLANERASALQERVAALEAQKTKEEPQDPTKPALRDQLPTDAPHPDAVDADGNPIYALGEFDPKYISDITEFTIERKLQAKQEEQQRAVYERQLSEQRSAIQKHWHEKLAEAEETLPEIREDISDLVDTFQSIDPNYGEYLASVILASEVGPQVMHYLSQNIGEARKIVDSGPAAATLAIGRLEARLLPSVTKEEKLNTKRVSHASRPPEARTRGSGVRTQVSGDTDDLDAFEREFFKKR